MWTHLKDLGNLNQVFMGSFTCQFYQINLTRRKAKGTVFPVLVRSSDARVIVDLFFTVISWNSPEVLKCSTTVRIGCLRQISQIIPSDPVIILPRLYPQTLIDTLTK